MTSRARVWLPLALALTTPACSQGQTPAELAAETASLVSERCAGCHRFEGEPESKFRIQAPDLMWGGQKYQRDWLVGFLQGEERSPYPGPYRWDLGGAAAPHPRLDADADVIQQLLLQTVLDMP